MTRWVQKFGLARSVGDAEQQLGSAERGLFQLFCSQVPCKSSDRCGILGPGMAESV